MKKDAIYLIFDQSVMVHGRFEIGAILTEENGVDTSEIIKESHLSMSQDILVSQFA